MQLQCPLCISHCIIGRDTWLFYQAQFDFCVREMAAWFLNDWIMCSPLRPERRLCSVAVAPYEQLVASPLSIIHLIFDNKWQSLLESIMSFSGYKWHSREDPVHAFIFSWLVLISLPMLLPISTTHCSHGSQRTSWSVSQITLAFCSNLPVASPVTHRKPMAPPWPTSLFMSWMPAHSLILSATTSLFSLLILL